MNTQQKTKMLTTAGIMIALSQILSYIKVYEAPQGGSVTAASMVPIIMFSLIYGIKKGLMASFVYGLLQFILGGGISIHPLSILLDYFIGFGVLGLAGIFTETKKTKTNAVKGAAFAVFLRFVAVFLSGWLVFGSYAPEGVPAWLHSLGYNLSYMVPELIITTVVIYFIYERMAKEMI